MGDLISVIVPAYNVAQEIVRCLDSICAQTYLNLEVVVVNDGSQDATPAILDRYASTHENVRVIHKENGGVTSARLCGVRESAGEWIGFVDGDDEIEADMYERLLGNAQKYGADISHCGHQMVFEDGRVHHFHNTGLLVEHDNITALHELLSGAKIEPGLWNKLYHKKLFHNLLDNNLMDLSIRINEDLLMNFYLFRESSHSVYEDFCPYHYIVRSASVTRSGLSEHALRDPIQVRKLILEQAPAAVADDARRAYLSACIGTCNRVVREKDCGFETHFWDARRRIQEKKPWLRLLSRKSRVYTSLILWLPKWYGAIYRFYFYKIAKNPYD